MRPDHLATDLSAFLSEQRRCGELHTGMTEVEPVRVWVTCTCGARIERGAKEDKA